MTTRRTVLAGILGVVAAPRAARAQPAGKVHRIGRLGLTNPVAAGHAVEAWRQALRERGWVEGQNLAVELRWAEGQRDRLPALAAELVALKVDLIYTNSNPGADAARRATTTIPIVLVGGDHVARGFAQSLARPAGTITGLTWDPGPEVVGKQLELLAETVPGLSRVAVLDEPRTPWTDYWKVLRTAALRLGVELQRVEAGRASDLDAAFGEMVRQQARALLVITTAVSYTERARLAALALQQRLPTMFDIRENVAAGGLMAYAVDQLDLDRRGAHYVDRILRGARPGDLPIEQPSKLDLIVNLRTARALGLVVPPALLARADEVIE